MRVLALLDRQRRIFIDQLVQGRRQLHLVRPVLDGDGQREQRRELLRPRDTARWLTGCRQQLASADGIEPAEADDLAVGGSAEFAEIVPLHAVDAADAVAA